MLNVALVFSVSIPVDKELASLLLDGGSALSSCVVSSYPGVFGSAFDSRFNLVEGISGGAKCGDSGNEGLHYFRLVLCVFVN